MKSTSFVTASWTPLVLAISASLAGCVTYTMPPEPAYGWDMNSGYPSGYPGMATGGVTSVYVDPPLMQPEPIMVDWAPPPMLVETPPPMPYAGALWIGGYWLWQDQWVWASGRWSAPPRAGYHWVQPYYENRGGMVVFVPGYWGAPGTAFTPPSPYARIPVVQTSGRYGPHPRPEGPPGVFVPPPPGSRPGLIVPAPLGTPPAVVIGAPPVAHPGMRIQPPSHRGDGRDAPQLTVIAPPGATANGRAFERAMPAIPHLAAAQPPVVRAFAPPPSAQQPNAGFGRGRPAEPMPMPQQAGPGFDRGRAVQPAPVMQQQPNPGLWRGGAPASVPMPQQPSPGYERGRMQGQFPAPSQPGVESSAPMGVPPQQRIFNAPAQQQAPAGFPAQAWPRERVIQGEPMPQRQQAAPMPMPQPDRNWQAPRPPAYQGAPASPMPQPQAMPMPNEYRQRAPAPMGRQEAAPAPQPRARGQERGPFEQQDRPRERRND